MIFEIDNLKLYFTEEQILNEIYLKVETGISKPEHFKNQLFFTAFLYQKYKSILPTPPARAIAKWK